MRDFIEKYVGISKLSEIVDILEGGGEAKMGISYVKNPTASSKHIGSSLKDINIFLEVRLEDCVSSSNSFFFLCFVTPFGLNNFFLLRPK